jgi:hypothetical protein
LFHLSSIGRSYASKHQDGRNQPRPIHALFGGKTEKSGRGFFSLAVIRCGFGCLPTGHWPLALSNAPTNPVAAFKVPVYGVHLWQHLSSETSPNPTSQPHFQLPLASPSVCFDWVDQPIAPRFTAGPSPMTTRSSGDQQ